jgi:hypothetical protein
MAVFRKAATGCDKIFVDNTQTPKTHVARVVILVERKRVIGVEPPVIEMPTLV